VRLRRDAPEPSGFGALFFCNLSLPKSFEHRETVLSKAGSREAPEPGADPWLPRLIAAGFALRAVVALVLDPLPQLMNDDAVYALGGASLVSDGVFDTGVFVRPPLYFVFVGLFQLLFGASWLTWLKPAQCALGAATAWPIYALARQAGGPSAARWAAAFWLFDPTLVAYAHLLWPETLFTWIVAWVFARAGAAERGGPRDLLALGALTGLAMLLKPVFGIFSALLACWWWQRLGFGRALRLSLVYGLTVAAVIAPWVVRNQVTYASPAVLLENQGPYNLWYGNDPRPHGEIYAEWKALPDAVSRSRHAREQGLAAISADPLRFAGQSASRAAHVWGLEFFVLRNVALGAYGDVSKGTFLAAFWAVQVGWVLMLLCAAAGLPRAWQAPALRPALLYALVLTLLVAAMVATTRFRVPLGVPLCVAAGIGASTLLAGRARGAALVAVGVAVAILVFSTSRPLFQTLLLARFEAPAELVANESWMHHRY